MEPRQREWHDNFVKLDYTQHQRITACMCAIEIIQVNFTILVGKYYEQAEKQHNGNNYLMNVKLCA